MTNNEPYFDHLCPKCYSDRAIETNQIHDEYDLVSRRYILASRFRCDICNHQWTEVKEFSMILEEHYNQDDDDED